MRAEDYVKLVEDLDNELASGRRSVGILGLTGTAFRLLATLAPSGLLSSVTAIYAPERIAYESEITLAVPLKPYKSLAETKHDLLVVADDEDKEKILLEALPFVPDVPKVLIAGYGHLDFRDEVFDQELAQNLTQSLANGYPNSLIHLYQCLVNAARLELRGVVAEFGMFKGGTTAFLARVIKKLGQNWRVIGFDTFDGFPPRRSPLDMYDHPGCVFTDLDSVRRYLNGSNIEIIAGDIVETCTRLADEDLVLTFVDTDNYTPASAALSIAAERTVVGGAIVLDHFTGTDRFRYTLGERLAGRILLDDSRYFHLHGTGVFYRQR